jgi:hypothetical protein
MIHLANAFILFIAAGAVWLGAAAVVQKRHVKRRLREHGSSNTAA